MSDLADTIKSRGFWRVTVRPSRFDPNHIDDYNRLFAVVRDSAVELRGWDCPHIDTQNPPRRENAWVGQETGWEHYRELWRLYRSGQFLFLGGYEEDWRDHSGLWPHPPKWESGRLLWIQDAIFSLTEFSKFAGRLAATEAAGPRMVFEIAFENLEGRVLRNDQRNVDPHVFAKRAQVNEWLWKRELTRAELAGATRELAATAAADLFARFGFEVAVEEVREAQHKLFALKGGS